MSGCAGALTGALLLAVFVAPAANAAGAEFLSRYIWESYRPMHGGFSGLELVADGTGFVTITDRGWIVQGTLERRDGTITGVADARYERLRGLDGKRQEMPDIDAEGLAMATDGTLFVSFEGGARVWRYDTIDTVPVAVPSHPDFATMQYNAALEALAVDDSGRLYTLPERSGRMSRPFPLYVFDGTAWTIPWQIPRRGTHVPTGADFGPDGMFYLLERDFRGLLGFSTRIRRFTLGPEGALTEETLMTTPNFRHGNLEGLSVWRDGDGAIRLTMIEDDNFSTFQKTQFVEYRVTD